MPIFADSYVLGHGNDAMSTMLKETKKVYETPLCKVLEVKARMVICETSNERFTVSSNSYDEDDWE